MKVMLQLLFAALSSSLIQNIIFAGGYGVSEALRISGKPKQILTSTGTVTAFMTISAVASRALDFIPKIDALSNILHMLIFVGVLFVVYFITIIIFYFGLHAPKSFMHLFSMSAFNTLVLAIPLLNRRAAYSIWECFGFALGAGVAFLVATYLINVGIRKIEENDTVPEAFKSTPVLFVYIGLLALAFMGFSGQSLFV
ncbi:MAG: hypothetical protein K5917_05925 [Clostridiales bacterium]|nr:hypothetical protein [Clostridiales bacterium]